ncbi:peroxidase P7-like [Phoenix dactylifera]|uniref:Peroxidase n=1 Tax=Phoenix dactylifera TaxID=42345 RepID=A0A8B7BP85_PHODC|nr:peroxidase P7-like [Phoenix dactylifera]
MAAIQMLFTYFTMISAFAIPAFGELSPDFYDEVCPKALPTIKLLVEQAIALEPRMGASLVRLHFHDCFVNGCDGSILLDDTPTFTGEKMAGPNNNSVRGFDLIDQIKAAVNEECQGNVVSCADILAVAARDSVVVLGGSCYNVLLGRRDATTASRDAANTNIPSPSLDLPDLIASFESHGLGVEDLVVLSGAHTLGFSRCVVFRNRIYNDTACIDGDFAADLQAVCPVSGEDSNLAPLDESPVSFDTAYYQDLVESRGLLHSDQQLFKGDGSLTDELVRKYSDNPDAFWADFGPAMIKMGNISPLTGCDGEIREHCRFVNGY